MRYVFFLCFLVLSIAGFSQVYNPIPQYVFRNKLGVGRATPVDSSAYMNIGPNGGANAGVVLPRVADTLSILGTKRNGLLIFSLQLNKFAYWDSTSARWRDLGTGGTSSGGEVMLMNGSGTVGDSLLFSSVSGDTAYIRNLWFVNGVVSENIGDTVLRVGLDSSQVLFTPMKTNYIIYRDGFTFGTYPDEAGTLMGGFFEIDDNEFSLGVDSAGNTGPSIAILRDGFRQISISTGSANSITVEENLDGTNKNILISTPYLQLAQEPPFFGNSDTSLHWNPSTGQVQRAVSNLTASATLDFPSTASGSVADLTVTVTGAAVGDVVSVGAPNGSVTATAVFFAWVSATDTVTVRFSPKATENPDSGTFKIKVFK